MVKKHNFLIFLLFWSEFKVPNYKMEKILKILITNVLLGKKSVSVHNNVLRR